MRRRNKFLSLQAIMFQRSFFLLLLLVAVVPFPAIAQTDTTDTLSLDRAPKMAFVDIEIILDSSSAIRTIVSEIDEELGEEERAIEAKKRDLRRIRLSLDRQSTVLSEAERRTRQQEALDLLNEIDDMEYRFQRKVREKQRTTVEPLLTEVIRIIGDVGRREKYDLIVRGEVVLWGRETVDLTPHIVKEVDARVDELRAAVATATRTAPPATDAAPRPAENLPLIP